MSRRALLLTVPLARPLTTPRFRSRPTSIDPEAALSRDGSTTWRPPIRRTFSRPYGVFLFINLRVTDGRVGKKAAGDSLAFPPMPGRPFRVTRLIVYTPINDITALQHSFPIMALAPFSPASTMWTVWRTIDPLRRVSSSALPHGHYYELAGTSTTVWDLLMLS